MRPHPTEACYCHVVAAGVRNVRRLAAAGDLTGVALEAKHLEFVAGLLDSYLLYCTHGRDFDESLHGRYWREVRPAYAVRAGPESRAEMDIPWEFLAFSLRFEYNPEQDAAADRPRD